MRNQNVRETIEKYSLADGNLFPYGEKYSIDLFK